MAAGYETNQFTKVSSAVANTQDLTLAAEPIGMRFWWTDNTGNDSRAITQNVGMGFTDFTNERCVVNAIENTADPTDTYRRHSASKSIMFLTPSNGNLLAEADVSKSGNIVTISWSTNSTNTPRIHYEAFYGTDLTSCKVGSITPAASTGSEAFTDPAMQGNFLMLLGSGQTAANLDTTQANAMLAYGFAASSTEEAALTWLNRDALASVDLHGYQRTDSCYLELTTAGAEDKRYDFTSFNANGFTLNKTTSGTATEVFYFIIQGGDWTTFSFNNSGTTGEQLITGLGLTPKGAFFASDLNNASTSILSEDSGLMFGAADGTNNVSIYIADDDAGAAQVVRGAASATYSLMGGGFGALNAQGSVQSFSSDTIDLEWAAANAAGDQYIGWAVANNAGGGGTAVKDLIGTGIIPFAR